MLLGDLTEEQNYQLKCTNYTRNISRVGQENKSRGAQCTVLYMSTADLAVQRTQDLKDERYMKARKDYVRLSRTGKRFFFDGFIAQAMPVENRLGLVGITVTKKLGNSVMRHRAKRRLHETVRLWNKESSAAIKYDIVLVARSKIFSLEFSVIRSQWKELLEKLTNNQDWTHETTRH